ncbi:hypothetical protein R3P38DRAFT_2782414 [Favolaschia claudopus]|uniref:Uncharacterized protein n=1 Tax=Favolaschia claudopus TaxID=2862362 RepID=A0AAW0B298_9AGAR
MAHSNSLLATIHRIISSVTPSTSGNAWSFAHTALYPVPHVASHVEEYAADLIQRKGYLKKVDCVLYATDERVPIVVPVPFNIGADLDDATIDDLFVHAYVAYAGLANIVDMSKGRRTVITHNFAPLDYPYTIFYTPPGVAEPKNMSLATNRGRIPWKGNVLVVKHHAYPETPMDVTREEVTRITIMIRQGKIRYWTCAESFLLSPEPDDQNTRRTENFNTRTQGSLDLDLGSFFDHLSRNYEYSLMEAHHSLYFNSLGTVKRALPIGRVDDCNGASDVLHDLRYSRIDVVEFFVGNSRWIGGVKWPTEVKEGDAIWEPRGNSMTPAMNRVNLANDW